LYVICKSCKEKFQVFPPSGDLNLGGQDVRLDGGSVEVNRITFGDGGRLSFGPEGRVVFKNNPPPRYRCPSCNLEAEYLQSDIHQD
jgi:hypothetical protein